MKVELFEDRILVKPNEKKEKHEFKGDDGRLYDISLPETAQKRQLQGVVLYVGPGKLLDDGTRLPMYVEEGDYVHFPGGAGRDLFINDVHYLVMRQGEVYCRVSGHAD